MAAIKHLRQEKGYSCGAACFAMVFGVPEVEARKLVHCTTSGTQLCLFPAAVEKLGHKATYVRFDTPRPLEDVLWMLQAQAARWPLVLGCDFQYDGRTRTGKIRKGHRQHAIVMHSTTGRQEDVQVFDPGESDVLDSECIDHLGCRGILVKHYVLVELSEK